MLKIQKYKLFSDAVNRYCAKVLKSHLDGIGCYLRKNWNFVPRFRNNLMMYFHKSTFFKNVALIASGTAASQIIAVISSPLVTRLYTPADYGIFTVFAGALAIIGQLSTLRYSVPIPLADNEDLADNVLRLCFLLSFSLSVLLGIVILCFSDLIASQFSVSYTTRYLWLLPICMFGKGLYEALSSWAVRQKNFSVIARTKLSQGISSALIKVGLGWLGVKPLGLLLGLLASEVAGTLSLTIKLIKEKPFFVRDASWKGMVFAAKRFSSFPLFQTWSRLLLTLGVQLPAMVMASYYGATAAGLFGLAHGMVNMPMNLLGTSVAQVYYAEIAKYGKSRPDKILKLSISIMKNMFLLSIIPLGAIMIAGPLMFRLVFGASWYDSGNYARSLSIMILVRFIATPIMNCLDVLEKQPLQLFLNILRVVFVFFIFKLCVQFGLSSKAAIQFYSIAFSFYYIFVIAIVFKFLFKMKRELA